MSLSRTLVRAGLTALLMLLATSCALLPQPEVLPPTSDAPPTEPAAVVPANATHYRVTEAQLTIYTFKAGWLKDLSHAHVIETRSVSGDIHLADPVANSTARLQFRPWDLELDKPESRAAAGAGFESPRSAEDIAATRTRMLGPRGFHSNDHPWVTIDVRWQDAEQVGLNIHFRDATYAFSVPLTWSLEGKVIRAAADFELSHRELGIRPYSAFAGAIAVANPIRVQLMLSARPAAPL